MIVPIGWKIEELGNEIEFQNGIAHENVIKEYGKYIVANSKFISTEGRVKKYSDVCMTPCHKNDILMVMSDVPNGRAIGKCFFVEVEDKYTLNQRICRMKSYYDNARLLYYMLNRNKYFLSFDDGVKQTNLRKEDILKCSIILPKDIEEQNAISNALSDVDNLIISLQKLIDKKKAIKQGTMQELLTGKRRLPGFCEKWSYINLADKSRLKARIGWQGLTKSEYSTSGYAYLITGTDFSAGRIDWKMCYCVNKYRFEQDTNIQIRNGDILITKDGTIGKVAFISDLTKPATLNSGVFVVRPLKQENYNSEFVYHILNSFVFERFLERLSAGSTINHLYQKDFVSFMFDAPTSLEEQQAIAQILSDMDEEIEQLQKKLAKYQLIRQGMMQELLTGHIRLVESGVQRQNKTKIIKEKSSQTHNQHFDDAVMLAGIVNAFYSNKYPLGRKKLQKLLYLLRRKQQADISSFHKKAAGPYADIVRYKGGEPIAKKNKYIQEAKSKIGSCFSKGENIQQAITYLKEWDKQQDIEWLISEFRYTKVDELELLATVDMAMCDLSQEGRPVTVQTIKDLIQSNKEWRDKLKKTYFSDSDIQRAVVKCREMFKEVF